MLSMKRRHPLRIADAERRGVSPLTFHRVSVGQWLSSGLKIAIRQQYASCSADAQVTTWAQGREIVNMLAL